MAEAPEEPNISYSHLSETQSIESLPAVQAIEKKPRRLIYCSDGVLEEYSTDEDEDKVDGIAEQPVDTSALSWPRWCLHHVANGAGKTLSAADYCGEKLAWFFGITSPKYQYAIDEYRRRMAEDQEDKEREEREQEAARQRRAVEMANMESDANTKPSSDTDFTLTFPETVVS